MTLAEGAKVPAEPMGKEAVALVTEMSAGISSEVRFRGCLLGLAVGDALGASREGWKPGTFEHIDEMLGGRGGRQPGQWNGDTSMALCLGMSLISKGAFDPRDQMERYLRWKQEGYMSSVGVAIGIGKTVRAALERFAENRSEPYAGSTDPNTAGNGSLMRLAPVPMYFAADAVTAIERCGDSSRTTHGAREAVDACRYYGGLLVGALRGIDKETLLSANYCPVAGLWAESPLSPRIAEIAEGSFKYRKPPRIQGRAYVVKSLEAALWAFSRSRNFREGALLAVNLGHDADTTAAIYGQLAGAHYGAGSIPAKWRRTITMGDEIQALADLIWLRSCGAGWLVEMSDEIQALAARIRSQSLTDKMQRRGLGSPSARTASTVAQTLADKMRFR